MAGKTPAASSPRWTALFSTLARSPTSSSVWPPLPACLRSGSTTYATSPPHSCSRPDSTSRSSLRPSDTRITRITRITRDIYQAVLDDLARDAEKVVQLVPRARKPLKVVKGHRGCSPQPQAEDDSAPEGQGSRRGVLRLSER